MPAIVLRAFAKINLGLRILGRRPDHYHEICTVYQTVALHDLVAVSVRRGAKGISVGCDDPRIPGGRDNLAYEACARWRRARGFDGGIAVRIKKTIPPGSGLGGASSDAAATLVGLEQLTRRRLRVPELLGMAARLGSDVPLFLWGGRVLGCGRGEAICPLVDLPRRRCLIVFPGFSIATATAYREAAKLVRKRLEVRRGSKLTDSGRMRNINSFGVWPQLPLETWGPAENDFERFVFAKWPELARLKRRLLQAGAETASLTGSGSAVYALFVSATQFRQAEKLAPAGSETFLTRTLPRAEYWKTLRVEHRDP